MVEVAIRPGMGWMPSFQRREGVYVVEAKRGKGGGETAGAG